MQDVLLVDGYNIIGAWKELQFLKDNHQLNDARDRLIEMLADYQAYSNTKIIVVFDAYKVYGNATTLNYHNIEVIYTGKKETADSRIEKLTNDYFHKRRKIYVATSDMAEQNQIFGNGAYRISAREFGIMVQEATKKISKKVENTQQQNKIHNKDRFTMTDEVAIRLEKMRRGNL